MTVVDLCRSNGWECHRMTQPVDWACHGLHCVRVSASSEVSRIRAESGLNMSWWTSSWAWCPLMRVVKRFGNKCVAHFTKRNLNCWMICATECISSHLSINNFICKCKSGAELFGRFFFLSRFFTDLSMIAKIKWPKSEEKMDFGGRWGFGPLGPAPPPLSKTFLHLWSYAVANLFLKVSHIFFWMCKNRYFGYRIRERDMSNVYVCFMFMFAPTPRLLRSNEVNMQCLWFLFTFLSCVLGLR